MHNRCVQLPAALSDPVRIGSNSRVAGTVLRLACVCIELS